ncbi:hypothetical protein [Pontivivens ytuae]|uniref:Uncharacterized protein n=1 Tax=Pontivivens ytuae TaxID=2789856 RepID=A0A7S9LP50_9RHOB|nr:hypothetical protein [Pontivivens ytuae]QPH52215.1 hypothetical protein I0K15_10230 [Pontivivens ytuae]
MSKGQVLIRSAVSALFFVLALPVLAQEIAGVDLSIFNRGPGTVLVVDSLDDDGEVGTLRWAVNTWETRDGQPVEGMRYVVFAVSGEIALERRLEILRDDVRVAGQTAPRSRRGPAGVTLSGAPLKIRGNRVMVEHIRVRPGGVREGGLPADDIDAIQIGPALNEGDLEDIVLRNVSASWSVDELVSVYPDFGKRVRRVSILSSLLAEPLTEAGHPRGQHNYGLLLRRGARGVLVADTLMAGATRRNPTLEQGSSAAVVNTLIANWGEKSPLHFILRDDIEGEEAEISITAIGNVARAGANTPSSTRNRYITVEPSQMDELQEEAPVVLFARDNFVNGRRDRPPSGQWVQRVDTPPVIARHELLPASEVAERVFAHAGAWPAARDATDARIVREIETGAHRWIAMPPDDPATPRAQGMPAVPEEPFTQAGVRMSRIGVWLETLHRAAGGI